MPQVIGAIKDSGRWADLRRRAESFLTLGRLAKVADLLPSEPETLARMVESESAPQTVCAFLIRRTLLDRFNGQAESWPAWARGLDRHPSVARLRRGQCTEPSERVCAAQRAATAHLSGVETALAEEVPEFDSAEALLDWYVAQRRHMLEFQVAEAFACWNP